MEKIIARCGLICTECEAYIATQQNDEEAKAEVAQKWTELYGAQFTPESITCDGCVTFDGRLSIYANEGCGIRKCCIERRIANCYYCEDYACETLVKFFELVPEVRDNLENKR